MLDECSHAQTCTDLLKLCNSTQELSIYPCAQNNTSLDAAGGEGDLVWPFLDNFHNSHIEALVDWQYERTTKFLWKFITF